MPGLRRYLGKGPNLVRFQGAPKGLKNRRITSGLPVTREECLVVDLPRGVESDKLQPG